MVNPVLVMIHGLIGSLEYFDPHARFSTLSVRTLDLLGYGANRDVPVECLTLKAQVDYVAGQLDHAKFKGIWVLGHSMGGAIAMLLADKNPELVRGVVNVEGNFTLKDAFWSRAIAAKREGEWAEEYRNMKEDIPSWLERCGIRPTNQRVGWAEEVLNNQSPRVVYEMSKAIVNETASPGFLDAVRRVIGRNLPMHLVSGERSVSEWDVPDFVRSAALTNQVIPDAGHLMMFEQPDAFCNAVESALA